jgi:2-dehydropantoate 2-reductase
MNILVVGAGAVGQVLGAHLQKGGARVTVLVKEKYAADARRGFTLQALHKKNAPLSFTPEVMTSGAEKIAWDLIVVCTSSTALKTGWLDELAKARGTFVCMQPGLEDPEYVAQRVGAERLVWGMFPLVSFADGNITRWYLPPFTKLPWSGPGAQKVVDLLNRGGLAARVDRDVPSAHAFAGPLLQMLVIAVEIAGWKLRAVAPQLGRALAAMREAVAVAERQRQATAPFFIKLLRPWMLRLALPVLRLAPFDVENYVQTHFTKVGDQTVAGLDTLIAEAQKLQLPSASLSELRHQLVERRA